MALLNYGVGPILKGFHDISIIRILERHNPEIMASIWKLWRPAGKNNGRHYFKRIMAPLRIEKRHNPGLWRWWNAF